MVTGGTLGIWVEMTGHVNAAYHVHKCKSAHHDSLFLCFCHVGQHHLKGTQQGVHCASTGPDRFCPTALLLQGPESERNHVCSAALSHSGIWLPITRSKYIKKGPCAHSFSFSFH